MVEPESFLPVVKIDREGIRLPAPSNLLRLQDPFERSVRSFSPHECPLALAPTNSRHSLLPLSQNDRSSAKLGSFQDRISVPL